MRTKKIVGLVATATAFLAAGQAQAQQTPTPPPPSSGGGNNSYQVPTNRLGRVDAQYRSQTELNGLFNQTESWQTTYRRSLQEARCVVGLSGENAGRFVPEPGHEQQTYRTIGRVMARRYRGCIHDPSGRVSPEMLAAAVAEELSLRNAEALPDRAMNVNVDDAAAFHGDLESSENLMASVARCIVVYSPGLSMRLFSTEVGSPEEESALDSLYARTPECGIRERPDNLPTSVQRSAVARAMYQWMHHEV